MKKRCMSIGTKYKRKATNAAKQSLYMIMWNEEVPKEYKRTCGNSKKSREVW